MRIVTWNCQGSFRRKIAAIEALQPDLAIIEECECAERLRSVDAEWEHRDIAWCGDRPTKGLAVVAFNGLRLKVDPCYDLAIKHLLPITVTGARDFHLLAVWTKQTGKDSAGYVGQACLGIQAYSQFIAAAQTVMAGDFNSNTIWDRSGRPYSHSIMVRMLAERGLHSAYHWHFREQQGCETRNTLFMARSLQRGYHIDYCFLPEAWLPQLQRASVGNCDDWLTLSDHCPAILDVDFSKRSSRNIQPSCETSVI